MSTKNISSKPNRNFCDDPTALYQEAISILRQLLKKEGLNFANRAYAEAVWADIQNQYIGDMTGPGDAHVCVHRLLGKRCPDSYKHPCDSPNIPGQDHTSEWVREGKTVAIVTQPYQLSFETMKELIAYCDQLGLRADITAQDSWHFPGATVKIELKRE